MVVAAVTTGRHEVFQCHLGHRSPVHVRVRDQVEGDVDPAGLRSHGVGMLIDRLLVERIDLGRLGRPTGRADLLGDLLESLPGAAGEEDLRSLAGEGACDRTADRPARSVDHGVLVLEQHVGAGHAAAGLGYPPAAEYSSATFGQFTTFHQASM